MYPKCAHIVQLVLEKKLLLGEDVVALDQINQSFKEFNIKYYQHGTEWKI